jgi:hypothetical protein
LNGGLTIRLLIFSHTNKLSGVVCVKALSNDVFKKFPVVCISLFLIVQGAKVK